MFRKIYFRLITVLFVCIAMLFLKIKADAREVHLAGLVVNTDDLKPVEAAKIYSTDNKLLGVTNKDGYYNISINCSDTGEIIFKLKIAKQGFKTSSDKEHWGNLSNAINMIMYFGLQPQKSKAASFSDFANGNSNIINLDYNTVLSGFSTVQAKKIFEKKLADVEQSNEDVFFKINDAYYIADNGGCIKLHSDTDIVSINNKQYIKASDLNKFIKRKNIKSMTPVNAPDAKFEIFTR